MNYLLFPIIFLFISCSNSHKEYTIQEFMDITSFGGSSFSYDEKKILIRSNQSGVFNAYEVNLETLVDQRDHGRVKLELKDHQQNMERFVVVLSGK